MALRPWRGLSAGRGSVALLSGHPLAKSLVFYAPLNEAAGQPGDLVTGTKATTSSGASAALRGTLGPCWHFQSSSLGLSWTNHGFFDLGLASAISVWVYPTFASGSLALNPAIVGPSNGSTYRFVLTIGDSSQTGVLTSMAMVGFGGAGYVAAPSGKSFVRNAWNHIYFIAAKGNYYYWVNGAYWGSAGGFSYFTAQTQHPLLIGNDGFSQPFPGYIAHVALFNQSRAGGPYIRNSSDIVPQMLAADPTIFLAQPETVRSFVSFGDPASGYGTSAPPTNARDTQDGITGWVLPNPNARDTQDGVTAWSTASSVGRVTQSGATAWVQTDCNAVVSAENPCTILGPRIFFSLLIGGLTQYLGGMGPIQDQYMGGPKPPSLGAVGSAIRAMSDPITGSWNADTANLTVHDSQRVWRGRLASAGGSVLGALLSLYLYSTPQRRAQGNPTSIFSGWPVRVGDPNSGLTVKLNAQDVIAASTELLGTNLQIPRRGVTVADFPNAPSSAIFGSGITGGLCIPIVFGTVIARTGGGAVKPIDVGVITISGTNYHAAAVACHACFDHPNAYISGTPIASGEYGTNFWMTGQPGSPGQVSWDATFPTRFVDINGHRYDLLLAKIGSTEDTAITSGTITVDVAGFETLGNGLGALITNPATQFKYIWINFILQSYQMGGWLPSPKFQYLPDGTQLCRVATGTFDAVAALTSYYLPPNGYLGAGVIGSGGQSADFTTVLQNFCLSFGFQWFVNNQSQIALSLFDNRRANFIGSTPVLLGKSSILDFAGPTDQPNWFTNDLGAQFNPNYASGSWDDSVVGYNSASQAQAVATRYFQWPYVRDHATAQAVATFIAGFGVGGLYGFKPPGVVIWTEGLCGLTRDLGDGVEITDYRGVGSTGYINRAVRIYKKTVNLKTLSVTFEAVDVDPLLDGGVPPPPVPPPPFGPPLPVPPPPISPTPPPPPSPPPVTPTAGLPVVPGAFGYGMDERAAYGDA